jgi:AcrR family transcriptional regulator
MRVYTNSRDKILIAAEDIVQDGGAGKLTLDAVAKQAGVSKGGLMHHYPTKEALLEAMVQRMLESYHIKRNKEEALFPKTPIGALKAALQTGMTLDPQFIKVSAGLLAAAANDPKLLEPVRKFYREHFQDLAKSGIRFELAALLFLASDGIYLLDLLGILPLSRSQREDIQKEMMRLAEQCEGETS